MKRLAVILVPLVLVSGILFGAFHFSGGGTSGRASMENGIRRMLEDPANAADAARGVSEYLAEFGAASDARWFAAWAYLEASRTGLAARAVWGTSALRTDPKTAPRFARMYLEWRMRRSLSRSRGDLQALVALADAGDPEAKKAILTMASSGDVGMAIETAILLSRAASPMLPAVEGALRARGSPDGRFAAALIGTSRDHPEDLPLVRDLVEGKGAAADSATVLRAAIALGASGDPLGLDLLRAKREAAAKDPAQQSQQSWWVAGLAAGGDPEALARLGDLLASTSISGPDTASLLDALIDRLRKSDVAAGVAAVAVWRTAKTAAVRRRLAQAFLLEGRAPPPGLDRDALLSELDASRDPVFEVLASAARLGVGNAEAALERLVSVFNPPGVDQEPTAGSDGSEAYLLAAKALSRLGSSGP